MKLKTLTVSMSAAFLGLSQPVFADETLEVDIHRVSAHGIGDIIGHVTIREHQYGVLLQPELKDLSPGLHGFHLHENPECSPASKDGKRTAAAAAGGHYDPGDTGQHLGPFETDGHHGDLPALFVDQDGSATQPELAPNLSVGDFADRSLVIHEGGDTYTDEPPLGGGGKRIACGVVTID